jgi:hypothetical protein
MSEDLEPGWLLGNFLGRKNPAGRIEWQSDAYVEMHTPRIVAELRKQGLAATPELVATIVASKILKPKTFADLDQREEWFRFLLPVVEEEFKETELRRRILSG